jgi:hypothetical protein
MIGCVLLAFALCNPNTPYGGYAYVQPQQPYYAQQQATVYPSGPPPGYGQQGPVYAQPQPYYGPPQQYAQVVPVPVVIPWVFWPNVGWGWWNGGRWFHNGFGGHFHGGHR